MSRSGAMLMLELLADFGVTKLFGNPGTTEMPLMDALLGQSRIRYVLGLQEIPVLAAADGYAQAVRELGVVNLHTCCGLGNAMGMIYNAHQAGTPLLITAGQQDRRLMFSEPVLGGDMVSVVRPWTKWAAEITRIEDLPSALRRGIQAALTPPTGPVFLSIPVDVQSELTELAATPPVLPNERIGADGASVGHAAALLSSAKNPLILAGARIVERAATEEIVALAELLGAPVMVDPPSAHGRMGFPCDHPLFDGWLSLFAKEVAARLARHDVILAVGMDLMREYIYVDGTPAIPPAARLVQLDDDPRQLGKNFVPAVALWGHLKVGLLQLSAALSAKMSPAQRNEATARREAQSKARQEAIARLRSEISMQSSSRPLPPTALMGAIADVLPEDVAVVEEAATTSGGLLEKLGAIHRPEGYFGHRGWALGWGLGCALGVSLAWPDRPVLAILGDGAAMYGIQGLWTAARERLPVTFLIANNQQYEILKHGARMMGLEHARAEKFLGLDLDQPAIDFVALAESLGVGAQRVTTSDEVRAALQAAFEARAPRLIEVPITHAPHGP